MVNARSNYAEPLPDLRMAGVAYRQIQLRPPFCVRAPLGDDWRLYLIRGGDVLFEADDTGQMRHNLPSGSVVALSGVLRHKFSSTGNAPLPVPNTGWVERDFGAPAEPGTVVINMGRIAQNRMAFVSLFARIVVFPADLHPELVARFGRAIDWIVEETRRSGPESSEIIRRLAEITTFEIGRFEHEAKDGTARTMAQAAVDQRLLRAISAFYAAPQEKWSVERLADIAGMSRTAFAVRYRQLIGTTPLRSLRQLRLQLAADQLGSGPGRAGVGAAAQRAGYGSGTSFIRAFAGEFGTTPGRVGRPKR